MMQPVMHPMPATPSTTPRRLRARRRRRPRVASTPSSTSTPATTAPAFRGDPAREAYWAAYWAELEQGGAIGAQLPLCAEEGW